MAKKPSKKAMAAYEKKDGGKDKKMKVKENSKKDSKADFKAMIAKKKKK
jgi:hypothetical protein